jgi:uncharacterized protein YdeI (YjbR/CyaY-like superfamily)
MLFGIVFTRDGGEGKFRQGMTDKGGVDSSGAVELLFEWEDDHHTVDALLDPTEASALPGPKLWAYEVDDWDVQFFQLACQAEVDVWEIDKDGDVGATLFDRGGEAAVLAIDEGHVTDDFDDAHVGYVFGTDDAIQTGGLHLLATKAEAGEFGVARAKLSEELGPVVVAAGFTGREEDARVGGRGDGSSVDFSGGACVGLSAAKSFRAVLEPLEGGLGWVVARIPFRVEATWKKMVRLRVTVEVGGEVFRTSLLAYGRLGGHFVLVNKKMQKAAGAGLGAMVDFTIAPDLEERVPVVPAELAKVFKTEKKLAKWFEGLSEATRWEIGKWIEGVKSAEARQRRAEQMAERLMLAMEGEKELPPVLEVAFRRTPAARKGWELLTLTQRRTSLLAVFYYQTPEAREKRVRKLVEDCLKAASRVDVSRR